MTDLRVRTAAALAILWLVWGSTYAVVSSIIPVIPPFALSSARYLVAGPVLVAVALARREALPSGRQLAGSSAVGALLFLGGNGGTVWSQTLLPSSVTAIVVACVPMWVALLGWPAFGERPPPTRLAAVALGALGVAGLTGSGDRSVVPLGIAAVLLGTLSWATGSLLSRAVPRPTTILMDSGVQMTAGGILLAVAAAADGAWAAVDPSRFDLGVAAGFAWLVVAGSIAAIIAYNWLLRNTSATLATTYAYVNPLVAVVLGWWLRGERLGPVALASSAAIVGAVALITASRPRGAAGRTAASTSVAPRPTD